MYFAVSYLLLHVSASAANLVFQSAGGRCSALHYSRAASSVLIDYMCVCASETCHAVFLTWTINILMLIRLQIKMFYLTLNCTGLHIWHYTFYFVFLSLEQSLNLRFSYKKIITYLYFSNIIKHLFFVRDSNNLFLPLIAYTSLAGCIFHFPEAWRRLEILMICPC